MTSPTGRAWAERTAFDVAETLSLDPVVIMPIAAVEQHGPHLPLSTDVDIGRGLLLQGALARLEPSFPAFHLPMQEVGTSEEHGDVAGTLSLDSGAMIDVIVAVGRSVASAGVRRLVIHNSHGGNRAAIDLAALRLRRDWGLLVVKAHWFRFPRPDVDLPDSEWEHGLHGGAVETAMMQHLRPELVRAQELRPFASLGEQLGADVELVRPEGIAPFAWIARDLNPAGVVGDPTLADAALGARLVDHYAGVLARIVRDARAFPLDRLAAPDPDRPVPDD